MTQRKLYILIFILATFIVNVISQPLLTDASATYTYKNETFKLGLYEGTNEMPAEHLADGMEIAKEMRSMSKINIVAIGHSVPTNIFSGWNWSSAQSQFKLAPNTNFVSACAPAVMAWDWLNRIKNGDRLGNLNNSDVHVLVVQLTWAPFMGPTDYEKNTPLSQKIDSMSNDFRRLAQNAKKNYPNLKMILFQADPWQNSHEPYHAYHEWFFARGVVLKQIKGDPELAYKGSNAKTVWIDIGGYFWYPNAPSSYYSDCCHITSAGATHYREKWITALLQYNPVISYWLLKEPPVGIENKGHQFSYVIPHIKGTLKNKGIEIVLTLADAAHINMGLFSLDGRTITPTYENNLPAGVSTIFLNTKNTISAGTYILNIDNGKAEKSIPFTLKVK
ncbi:MAG: hypothetical protein N2053_05875 [Chitinispirillaceae bacterium]|nr:hypothetical protein [Chitinispirillaceae bacterium]